MQNYNFFMNPQDSFFLFLEKKDQKFKADINGPTHLAGMVGEPVEPPPPCRPGLPTLPS
jgi:hypothetical protein